MTAARSILVRTPLHRYRPDGGHGTPEQEAQVTTYRRRLAVPDGHYCVADVDGQLTYWTVVAGRWADWPDDARWRPACPRMLHVLNPAEHVQRRQDWYDDIYGPWCSHIADAIEADPAGAAETFRARHGAVELPPQHHPAGRVREPRPPRVYPTPAERERARQADAIVVMRLAGLSYARIARVLDLPKTTTFRRARGRGW
jgi:hypothetical protein